MITVIDYNAGNLKSVKNAVEKLGYKVRVTKNPNQIAKAEKIIFPGVGAAGAAMKNLKKLKLIKPIKKYIKQDKPFLGICLGAQILLDSSEEDNTKCLNIIKGKNKKFKQPNLVVPHMGWNQVNIIDKKNKLFKNIKNNSFFYFVHSYYLEPAKKNVIIGKTKYGKYNFVSAIAKNNFYAVQFHPEKSDKVGLKLLNNFCNL